jgi:hypothetical protein
MCSIALLLGPIPVRRESARSSNSPTTIKNLAQQIRLVLQRHAYREPYSTLPDGTDPYLSNSCSLVGTETAVGQKKFPPRTWP